MSDELTHFNKKGDAHMVDVGAKDVTQRKAIAQGSISLQADTIEKIKAGDNKKGDVLGIARVAAIMATKRTAELIPLCHPLPLSHVSVDFEINATNIVCKVQTETEGKTGVEMEALSGVNIALLTIYDMCKAVDKGMQISDIHLLYKSGGKTLIDKT